MKHSIRILAMILVLLVTVSAVACSNNGNKEEPEKDKEKETERHTEEETQPDMSPEEIEELKAEMSAAILEALADYEKITTGGNEDNPQGGNPPQDGNEEDTTSYTDYVEGLLGVVGGLMGEDYNYTEIISGVLDQYIGSESTSEFILDLIVSWFGGQTGSSGSDSQPPTDDSGDTTEPGLKPPTSMNELKDYIAHQTADAIADAITDSLTDIVDGTIRDAIYDAVYESMSKSGGFMESILGGMIQ